jgi:hypothetical protein
MSTPYSYRQYAGNGATTTFSVPFPYLLKAHVHLYLGFNIVDGTFTSELVDGVGFTWTSGTQVQCTTAPASGETLTVVRQTPSDSRLVDWQDGSNLIADDLDTADLQNLYVVQEQQDRNDASVIATANATAAAAASAASATASAQQASTDSQTAISTANGAVSTANSATSTANSAVSTANSAVSTANSAVSTANNAVAIANGVVSLSRSAIEAAAIIANASFSIGRPGATPFGVGPYVPSSPAIAGAGQGDYHPIHAASGSFI